jgi:hypothetical protein
VELLHEVAELKQLVAAQRGEITRLKGLKGRSSIKPSGMEKGTEPKPGGKRAKRRGRGKVIPRVTPETEVIRVAVPKGSQFNGYEPLPAADVSLSLLGLLFGRIEPRGIEIDHPRIRVFRSVDGAISLDLGTGSDASDSQNDTAATATAQPPDARPDIGLMGGLLAEFAKPAGNDLFREHGRFRQLSRVRIADASVVVVDRQLQATWGTPTAEIELTRGAAGGVTGRANLTVTLGDQTTRLSIAADLAEGGTSTHIRATTTPIVLAALARAAVSLAPLRAVNAPVDADMVVTLGPTQALEHARITVQLGAGDLHMGSAVVPVVNGNIVASGDTQEVSLESARLALRGHDGGAVSTLSAKGTLQRQSDRLHTDLALLLDQVRFADLPKIWPHGIGGDARGWITENVTAGTARNGQVEVQIDMQPDFSDAASMHGTLDADGLTVHWLRPIPPIDEGAAQLRILDPDTLEIAVRSGRQRPEGAKITPATSAGGLVVRGGTVRITGVAQRTESQHRGRNRRAAGRCHRRASLAAAASSR